MNLLECERKGEEARMMPRFLLTITGRIVTVNRDGKICQWKIRKSISDTLYWRCILDITLGSGVDI